MHQYWMANRVAPDVRHVVSFLVGNNALDKKAAKTRIFALFPNGYVQQA
jgi:sulfur relay (sulfurtransferase) DsrC/TusE family protein